MMRVIAGTARGKNLAALPGEDVTRPTINRVKEAMFSSVQFSVPGARVLDLFAGSGQLGIEALSRGAKRCVSWMLPARRSRSCWPTAKRRACLRRAGSSRMMRSTFGHYAGRV